MIELADIKSIIPNPKNPRIIRDEKFLKLVKSLQEFPEMLQIRPIVVNESMVVLGGNMRLKALKEAGIKKVPIIKASLSEDKQREFIIKDNVGFGEWDWSVIANEWDTNQLSEWGLDIPGFETGQEAVEDDYEIPDEIETDIVLGDLFEIGEHRLLCGDSTNSDDVGRLMSSQKADMVFTDPPYNADYSGLGQNNLGKIKNDNMSDNAFEDFIQAFISTTLQSIKDGASLYFCCNWKDSYPRFYTNLSKAGVNISANIVWNKGSGGMGWQDYRYQYEFIIYGFKKGASHSWYGGRTETDIWDFNRDHRSDYKHPTQKPVTLPAKAINNSSKQGDLTLDLFAGSGTTMVAAHQLNRKCYGMELDPKNCQVILDRMLKLDSSIIILKNGTQYATTTAIT